MLARAALIATLCAALAIPAASVAAPASTDAPVASAAAKKKPCKKGKVRKGKRCVKKGPVVPPTPAPAPPVPAPDPNVPGGLGQTPPATLEQALAQIGGTQDDAALQQAMGNGLLLERSQYYNTTADFERIFFFPNGTFKLATVSWNEISGEICDKVYEGTWSLVKGYRFTAEGGGLIAIVQINAGGLQGTELLAVSNADQSHVYVGASQRKFDINPHMLNGC